MFDRDMFTNIPVKNAAVATMRVVDALQDNQPHEQVAALAAAFVLACERHGIEPQDAFAVSTNIMNHADGRRPEFIAVRQYMEHEW